jgi:hypothetical protein
LFLANAISAIPKKITLLVFIVPFALLVALYETYGRKAGVGNWEQTQETFR